MEEIEDIDLDQLVDVYEDSVTINLPDMLSFNISDIHLNYLIYHPEEVVNYCSSDQSKFWNLVFPRIAIIRDQKRDLYHSLGF